MTAYNSDLGDGAHVPHPQLQSCPFGPLGSFEPGHLIGWQRKLWGDELLPLVDLCDRLCDSGMSGNSLRVRVALVAAGPNPLAVTIDPDEGVYVLHQVEHTLPTIQPEYMAWLVQGRLAAESSRPGEPS